MFNLEDVDIKGTGKRKGRSSLPEAGFKVNIRKVINLYICAHRQMFQRYLCINTDQ